MSSTLIHVAVGVVINPQGKVLISKRPDHVHQGGLWEFPGGKLEAGESIEQALQRELEEELGIHVEELRPLIRIPYQYTDKNVLLDVWQVTRFSGVAKGMEGQPLKWLNPEELVHYAFPAANQPIVNAVRLPERYLITGEFTGEADFASRLEAALQQGIRLVQVRAKHLAQEELAAIVRLGKKLCESHQARLILNSTVDDPLIAWVDGLHLSSARLMALKENPLPAQLWLAASVHDEVQLRHAQQIGVDFVVVSPVMTTLSHPQADTIGWSGLQHISAPAQCPVYALGGMQENDLHTAWQNGAQGIAAISAFWPRV